MRQNAIIREERMLVASQRQPGVPPQHHCQAVARQRKGTHNMSAPVWRNGIGEVTPPRGVCAGAATGSHGVSIARRLVGTHQLRHCPSACYESSFLPHTPGIVVYAGFASASIDRTRDDTGENEE